jgi:hypothetical protein
LIQIRATLAEQRFVEDVPRGPPGIGAKKVQESSRNNFGSTYIGGSVAVKSAGVDLDICIISINSPALEVACPPPGHREISGKFL